MAGATGIEPALTVLETGILPLNYAPVLSTQNEHLNILSLF